MEKAKPGCASLGLGILALFGLLVVLAGLLGVFSSGKRDATQPIVEPTESEAVVVCQNFVRKRLRAPSTADFPWLDRQVVRTRSAFHVHSYVDSENMYGAKIRTSWDCTVSRQGQTWHLLHLELE